MFGKKGKYDFLVGAVMITGAVGGFLSYWLGTAAGKNTKKDVKDFVDNSLIKAKQKRDRIIEDAKSNSANIVAKAADLYNFTKNYAEGKYKSLPKFEAEFNRLKNALTAAIIKNKGIEAGKPTEQQLDEIFTDYEDRTYTEYDDDTYVKNEGMGHRYN
jgi:hypothetical protein